VIANTSGTTGIYTSSNYGQSWIQTSALSASWYSVSLSASGQYQTAVIYNAFSGTTGIYTSSNYGQSWIQTSALNAFWYSVSLSASGQYQTAVINNNFGTSGIWYSSNYGQSWNKSTALSASWYSVSVSSSGQYQIAVYVTGIYVSSNYGCSWIQSNAPSGSWRSVSVSSSGQYISAVVNGGGIYTTSIATTSQNNIVYNLYLTGATGQTGGANNSANTNNNVYCNNVYAASAVYANNIALTSDYRIKENIKELDNKFLVDYLKPVTFMNKQTKKQDIGLIAHELQEIYPELVNGEKDGAEIQTVNYIGLIPILINEIKNLKNKNNILEDEIKNIKHKLEKLGII
jgi:hypothetical protein